MLVDALVLANPVLKLSEAIYNPEKYLYLTDSVVEEIERSTNSVNHHLNHPLALLTHSFSFSKNPESYYIAFENANCTSKLTSKSSTASTRRYGKIFLLHTALQKWPKVWMMSRWCQYLSKTSSWTGQCFILAWRKMTPCSLWDFIRSKNRAVGLRLMVYYDTMNWSLESRILCGSDRRRLSAACNSLARTDD